LSRPRRAFGDKNLGIKYVNNPACLNVSVDLLFSSHVIEHMSNPDNFKKCADIVLKPDSVILLTCPNGSDSARLTLGWSKLWGEVHPNFISDQ
jgi:predicted SAM-dependent methyltransferase